MRDNKIPNKINSSNNLRKVIFSLQLKFWPRFNFSVVVQTKENSILLSLWQLHNSHVKLYQVITSIPGWGRK